MNALSRLLLLLASLSLAGVAPTAVDAAVSCHRIDASGVGQDQGGGNTVAQISNGGLLQGTTAAAFTITGSRGPSLPSWAPSRSHEPRDPGRAGCRHA